MEISFSSPFKTSTPLSITHCFSVLHLTNSSSSKFAEQKSCSVLNPETRQASAVQMTIYLPAFVFVARLQCQPLSSGVDFPEIYPKFAPNRTMQ